MPGRSSILGFCLGCFGGLMLLGGCAKDLGTGPEVVLALQDDYPITVGRLVEAHMDTTNRLRVYLEICEDAGPDGPICEENSLRVLALVQANKKSLLQRISERYLTAGRHMPVYVYGPRCEGIGEMILVPRCQQALAMGIWDPHLRDYVFYSTRHGSDSLLESEGFNTFLEVTGRAAGILRKAGMGL